MARVACANPWFAGGICYFRGTDREEVVWNPSSSHPAYISREQFEALQKMRRSRDIAGGSDRRPKGRPNENHLLAGLAFCGSCESILRPRTSNYRHKTDGKKRRVYQCSHVTDGTGLCNLPPLDATLIDSLIVDHLSGLFLDLGGFIDRMQSEQDQRSAGLEAERAAAVERLADLELRDSKLRQRFAEKVGDSDEDAAQVIEATLVEQRHEARAATRRLADLDQRLVALAEEYPADPGLDFRWALRGELNDILARGTIREVREGLVDHFERFIVNHEADGTITVLPVMRADAPAHPVYGSWTDGAAPRPEPLACVKVGNSHE